MLRSIIITISTAVLLALPSTFFMAFAADSAPTVDVTAPECLKYPEVAPGIHVQEFDSVDVTGGIAGLPDRVITGLSPGESGTICVGFHNRTGEPLTLAVQAHDLGPNREGQPQPVAPGDANFGAASWMDLPADVVKLEHGELAWFAIPIKVPQDTSGGSNYAAVSATIVPPGTKKSGDGIQARVTPSVAVQVYFDVQGDTRRGGKIEDVDSPRIVWWDGLGVGDLPLLDKFRGRGIAPVRFSWKNTGSYTEEIDGSVRFDSDLSGKTLATQRIDPRFVFRGSSRRFTATWANDIPIIGRFTPEITVKTSDGKLERRKLDPIWVIPAWWYLLLVAAAVALPLWLRRRSRQRYDDLLARVEAAESRGDGSEFDEDAWDGDDEWTPRA